MNTTMIPHSFSRCILAVLFVFALAGVARGQRDAGFIGKRYVGVSLFLENIRTEDLSNGNGIELNGNVPLTDFLDASVRVSSEKINDYDISDQRFGGSLIGYADMDTWKPFMELSVANTAQSSTIAGKTYKNSENYWSVGVGIEAAVTKTVAIFGAATLNNYFDNKRDSYWTYKLGLNTWLTPKIGCMFSVSFYESESVTYTLGMNYRF
jgi:hypothetical protein